MGTVFIWIFSGVISGGLLFLYKKNVRGGVIGAIFLGILGAIEGGYLPLALVSKTTNSITVLSYLLSIMGALFFLGMQQVFSHDHVIKDR